MNPKVDKFFRSADKWREEMTQLRRIALDCGLTEELKWGKPCYTFQGSNVCILQPFKASCALMFFKGALLKDPKGILEAAGENSRVTRRISFTAASDIKKAPMIKSCIREAIEAERAGLKVTLEKNPGPVPEELQCKLDEGPDLKAAFESLTPGRQRAYILHVSAARQSKTRTARVEKWIPRILEGKGPND